MFESRNAIGRGLEILATGLTPVVTKRLAEVLPGVSDWTAVLEEKDRQSGRVFDDYNPTDVALLLRAITERLGSLGYPFQSIITRQGSAWANELRTVRNRWAHNAPFSAAEAYRALDTACLLLTAIEARTEAESVAVLRNQAMLAIQEQVATTPAPRVPVAVDPEPVATPDRAPDHNGAEATIRVEAVEVLSYALAHNRVPILNEITVDYRGAELRGASITISATCEVGPLSDPKITLLDLDGERATTLQDLDFTLDPAQMLAIDTQLSGTISITLRNAQDVVITAYEHAVDVLASNQWIGRPAQLALELIASFVQPNAREIRSIAGEVADTLGEITGSTALDGYQSGSPERVDAMAEALFRVMQRRGIRYAEPPASWGTNGQKVRTPEEVLIGRLGTCLDTSVVFAAALEEIGINSTLWFVPGHAFVGYWRHESSLDAPAEMDASEAINYVGLGALRVVETTAIPLGLSFAEATRRPESEHLAGGAGHFVGVTDIQQARQAGIFPLPSRSIDREGLVTVSEYRQSAATPALDHIPAGGNLDGAKARALPGRVTQWKNALLDLSLRNRLINYSDRAGHTLGVPATRLPQFEDAINAGAAITLVAADDIPTIDRARGIRRGHELPETQLMLMLEDRKRVFIDLSSERYSSSLRSLAHKAKTIAEETGANNLYLALGMLQWQLDGRDLRSPLILVPVTLTNTSRGTTFRITLDEAGESTPNYCLLERLKVSFGLEIPGLANPVRDDSGIDLSAALAATRRSLAAAKLPFTVVDSAELAILQFAKFRLWKDIDENWQEMSSNPLVKHLIFSPTEMFVDPVATPKGVDLDALIADLPVAADSSQAEAVAEAAAGRTFVLEGPPGTGKSQTITNLLAHAIAEGKKVLFVAEKRAALDVVKQRLDAVGFGDLSLDLHDKGARPAAFAEQLQHALDANYRSDEALLGQNRQQLQASSSSLRRYAERLHEPNAFGLSLYSAHDRVLTTAPDMPSLPVPVSFVRQATPGLAEQVRTALRRLPETADLASPAKLHPWGFVGPAIDANLETEVYSAAREFDSSLSHLLSIGFEPRMLAAARTPISIETWAKLAQAPRIPLSQVDSSVDLFTSGRLDQMMTKIGSLEQPTPEWGEVISAECLFADVQPIHEHAVAADASGFFGRKKRQRSVLSEFGSALKVDPDTFDPRQVSGIISKVLRTAETMSDIIREAGDFPTQPISVGWNPYLGTGVAPVMEHLEWLSWLLQTLSTEPCDDPEFVKLLRDYFASSQVDDEASAALSHYAAAWLHLETLLAQGGLDRTPLRSWGGNDGMIAAWLATRNRRNLDIETPLTLQRWTAFLRDLEILHTCGLDEAHAKLKTGELPADLAVLAFNNGLAAASVLEREETQGLAAFDYNTHDRSIARFLGSGTAIRGELPRWLPQKAASRRTVDPRFAGGNMGDLKRQLTRKRGRMTVRAMFEHFESIILQITPCVLMSPESVSRFLPVRHDMFDIVVFDEASQIRVADAVGAIGRGRSVVVVGDSKQMPPTSFAEAQLNDDADDSELPDAVASEESILVECVQARVPQQWLSWHYRSQDEALISFSNHTYYDKRLSSFPSPLSYAPEGDHGVSLIRVDGHFDRSGKGKSLRTNLTEAQAIVDDVARRFEASPTEVPSLGVVTFNAQQRTLIESMLREHANERLGEALDARDGLFVKNLENVQGDERDTILFSIAFSANDQGIVPLNFGPLTRAGGERRLNVAITRARRQVVLYVSFDPKDLRAENTVSVGIKHLRAYMELAIAGARESLTGTSVQPIADRHRDEIAAELRLRGFAVETDLGLSDFRVDISVATADHPERPLLAILLDGPSWRERNTVADRDGLPAEVLGKLMHWPGVERVWLPAWLRDREGTLNRLAAAVDEAARKTAEQPAIVSERLAINSSAAASINEQTVASVEEDVPTPQEEVTPTEIGRVAEIKQPTEQAEALTPGHPALRYFTPWTVSWIRPTDVLDALPGWQARQVVGETIRQIVTEEGPIHVQRLAKLVGETYGLSRVADTRVKKIIGCIPSDLLLSESSTFVWPAEIERVTYSEARQVADGEARRDLESVSLEEIANAMAIVAELSGGMSAESIQREALNLFGGKRITEGIRKRLNDALEVGETSRRLKRANGLWMKGDRGL